MFIKQNRSFLFSVLAVIFAGSLILAASFFVDNRENSVSSGSCSDFNGQQVTCQATVGCSYPYPNGSGVCSDFNNSSANCNAVSGCSYPGDQGSCSSFNQLTTNGTGGNSSVCTNNSGCSYPANLGACSPLVSDPAVCTNTLGCTYSSGSGSCEGFDPGTCQNTSGCSFSPTYGNCSGYNGQESSCNATPGCSYINSASCSEFNGQAGNCGSTPGCSYPANAGSCSAFNGNSAACGAVSGCSYPGNAGSCSNLGEGSCGSTPGCTVNTDNCNNYFDEGSCTGIGACSWDGSSCQGGSFFLSCTGNYDDGSCTGGYDDGSCVGNYNPHSCYGNYVNGGSCSGTWNYTTCTGTYDDGSCTGNYDDGSCTGNYDATICVGTYDNTAPVLQSTVVDGTVITLTFDENLDTNSIPDPATFSIRVNDGSYFSPGSLNISNSQVLLTIPVVIPADTVEVNYSAFGNPIQDISGNDVSNFSNQVVTNNSVAPTISHIYSNIQNSTYGIDQVIDINVVFSEAVTSTGNVTVTLDTGGTCTFTISNSTTGTCDYTVLAGHTSLDLSVSSVSGTIADQSGNVMSNFSIASNLNVSSDIVINTVVADSTAPTITSITSNTATGHYNAGDIIDIDVLFSENVTSTGNVTVTLETGATDRTCTFTVSNSDTGTCNYTVQAGDTTSDLDATISGTIADQASNALVNFTPSTTLATNKALTIDTTSPTVSVTAPTEGATIGGASVSLTADASDTNLVGVQFKYNTNTNIDSEDTTSTYGVTWDVSALPDGAQSIIAVARDTAGNYATSTAINVTINNDSDAPVISAGSPSTEQVSGTTQVTLSVTTDENATCKYGTIADTVYASIANTFDTTGTTSHSQTITGLTDGTTYLYYIRCTDGTNTNSTDYAVTFNIAQAQQEGSVATGSYSASSESNTNTNTNIIENIRQTLVNTILSLIAKLQEQLNSQTNTPASDNNPQDTNITFNINLSYPMIHPDVKRLQQFLNNNGFIVALQGPGSKGNETNFFGLQTQSALIQFQIAKNITPAIGFFGEVTRGVVNNMGSR